MKKESVVLGLSTSRIPVQHFTHSVRVNGAKETGKEEN